MNDLHDQFNREAALQLLHPPIYEEVNPRDESHDLDNCCKAKNYFTLRHKKRCFCRNFLHFQFVWKLPSQYIDMMIYRLRIVCSNFATTLQQLHSLLLAPGLRHGRIEPLLLVRRVKGQVFFKIISPRSWKSIGPLQIFHCRALG